MCLLAKDTKQKSLVVRPRKKLPPQNITLGHKIVLECPGCVATLLEYNGIHIAWIYPVAVANEISSDSRA